METFFEKGGKMIINQKVYETMADPRIDIPTPQQLFDLQVNKLREIGIVFNSDEFLDLLDLRKHLPDSGLFILVPRINLTLDELMVRVELDGVGGRNWLVENYVKDVVKTPKTHYFVRDIDDGRKMLNISSREASKTFFQKKRFGWTVREGVFCAIYFPFVLKHHYINLVGSRYRSGLVPVLYLDGGWPGLDWYGLDRVASGWGAASCGSRIGL